MIQNNYQLSNIHLAFQNEFIEAIPSQIKIDVLERLKNPDHKGKGLTSTQLLNITSKVFNGIKLPNASLYVLTQELYNKFSKYGKRNSVCLPAANSAQEILKKMDQFFTSNTEEFFRTLPFEVSALNLNLERLSSKDLVSFSLTSKGSPAFIMAKDLKIAQEDFRVKAKAKAFAEQLTTALEPFRLNDSIYVGLYRNSTPSVSNMVTALVAFSKEGKNAASFSPANANGQGSSAQPGTVMETFKAAISSNVHGGVQDIIKAAKNQNEDKYKNLIIALENITAWLKTLDLEKS